MMILLRNQLESSFKDGRMNILVNQRFQGRIIDFIVDFAAIDRFFEKLLDRFPGDLGWENIRSSLRSLGQPVIDDLQR